MASHDDRVAFWTGLFAEQKLSGFTVPDFCKDRGVSIHSYRGWRARLNKEASSNGEWLTLKAQPAKSQASSMALRIGEVSIDVAAGFDPELLREVVSALRPLC